MRSEVMNEEQREVSVPSLESSGGKGEFERSENSPLPATHPAGAGVPPGLPPTTSTTGGLDADEPWEDPWPVKPSSADERKGPADSPSPNLKARRRGTLASPVERPRMPLSPQQRLLLLDTWQRSGLPARDFGALVNISRHTLYAWKRRFEQFGPAGLIQQPKGAKPGSKLPDLTKRTILMLKQSHPDWG